MTSNTWILSITSPKEKFHSQLFTKLRNQITSFLVHDKHVTNFPEKS